MAPLVAHAKSLENAEDQCFSYSNEHNTVPRAGIEPTSKNIGSNGHWVDGGPAGGPLGDETACFAAFCERLKAAGFTAGQLREIDDALRECGLAVKWG